MKKRKPVARKRKSQVKKLPEPKPYMKHVSEGRGLQPGFLHVTAGIEDVWIPTREELDGLTEQFSEVSAMPVVVTRVGVSVSTIDISHLIPLPK